MSIVCCKVSENKIEIASDSIIVRGYTQNKSENKFSKLFKVNDLIIGSVGSAEESSLLQLFCKTHNPKDATEYSVLEFMSEFLDWKKNKTDKYEVQNDYIMIYEKRAFYIEHFYVNEILTFEAIGIGRDFALAAIHNKATVKEAVKTACELSVFCEEPINYMEVLK